MNRHFCSVLLITSFLCCSSSHADRRGVPFVTESARDIPVAYDVDVIVVGGSTRGVAAAVAAAKAGASVFLAAERPYLGEDMCATYRLWLNEGEIPESELEKAIFMTRPQEGDTNSVPFVPSIRLPTQMQVKRALDDALLDAGVTFLYGSYVADRLEDRQGRIAGVTIVNRSGRQAVRGRVVIDATDRAMAARICGAAFAPYPKGPQTFSRIVIGGAGANQGVALGHHMVIKKRTLSVFEHTLQIEMMDASWSSFARAEQEARNLTWADQQVTASERLYQVPPDPLKARATQSGAWDNADAVNLDALRPLDLDGLYVLGACAAVSREAAAVLMRPLAGMRLGMRVGALAAAEAKASRVEAMAPIQVAGNVVANARHADVGEMLQGIRSMAPLKGNVTIHNPARSLPVLGRYDTVVVGGGTGGASAGIGAARGGARTLVVEYLYGLGGVGTTGRISKYYHGNKVGFTAEIDAGVSAFESDGYGRRGWNIEHKMEWLRREIVNAGGDIWFRCLGAGSLMDGDRCIGIVVATPMGRGAVLANTVIDATGNAVIPACAGMATQSIQGDHISVQGTGLPQQTPGEGYYNSDWTFVDDDDVLDMWRIMVVAKQMQGGVAGKSDSGYPKAFDLGQLIDSRARRRIIGDIVVSPMDIVNQRTYPDTITVSKSNFDNHGFSSHDLFMVTPPDTKGLVGNVPYRALLPKGKDGILVTGLGMSAHGDAMPVMRMQADVQNHGYAAGVASAMAAEEATTVRKIDVKRLQKHLVDVAIISADTMNATDSYPISAQQVQAAVGTVGSNYTGIARILANVPAALPMLREAHASTEDEARKLRYAHVLGMLHSSEGALDLIKAIEKAQWDEGWNFKGLGQYGATTSAIDNQIIALGRTRDLRGLPVVLNKLKALTPESEFSHCRAVAMALERFADSAAVKPLAALLRQPGMSGHAYLEIEDVIARTPGRRADTSTRNASLKELLLARALYRCGDYEGVAKNILAAYAEDYRGHYSRHAKAILKDGR